MYEPPSVGAKPLQLPALDFPGCPGVKPPCFHCRGHGLDAWSPSGEDPTLPLQGARAGSLVPHRSSTCCEVQPQTKNKPKNLSTFFNYGMLGNISRHFWLSQRGGRGATSNERVESRHPPNILQRQLTTDANVSKADKSLADLAFLPYKP